MKIHIKDSPEPLREGRTIIANCGASIPKASFAFVWDEQPMGKMPSLPALRLCRKCADHRLCNQYIYGIVEGQNLVGGVEQS